MKTFTESLQITTNIRILKESFILMSEYGINPNDFVEWYTTDGIGSQDQGLLVETSEKWLESKFSDWIKNYTGRMTSALGFGQNNPQIGTNPVEPQYAAHVKNAENAIDSLSKRMSRSKSLMEKLGGVPFQAAVVNLLNMLRNPSNLFKSNPTQTQTEVKPNAVESNGFEKFTHKIRLKNEIKTGFRTLQQSNIDPVKLVDWYIEEGQYLNEGMFDGAKDWFGRQWSNAKGAWNQWGKAGNEYQVQKDKQRDNESIQQAMKALGELENGIGGRSTEEFFAVLKQVQNQLIKAIHQPDQTQPDQTQPDQTQPDQDWKSNLNIKYIEPDDETSVDYAMKIFHDLPEDQKEEIEKNARKLWFKKENITDPWPSDALYRMSSWIKPPAKYKAMVMQMMATGKNFDDIPSLNSDNQSQSFRIEGVSRMLAFSEYLKLRS